jgi:hypothetical protein
MHPQIETLLGELDAASASAATLGANVDETAFHARPASGGWSAAECLVHLSLTTAGLLPRIDAALDAGRPGVADDHRYGRGIVGSLLARSMEPPVRMRSRTIAAFVPDSTGSRDEVLAAFERSQTALAERLRRASGLNLDRLRIASPFSARVKYNVYAAFCVLLAHERRHLWQAGQAIAEAANPPSRHDAAAASVVSHGLHRLDAGRSAGRDEASERGDQ